MSKIVVSADEVAGVVTSLPGDSGVPRLPSAVPIWLKLGLPVLVFALPLLCLATISVWLFTRSKEPCIQTACLRYCCMLLVISGLLTSLVVGVVLLLPHGDRAGAELAVPPLKVSVGEIAQPGNTLTPRELASRTAGQVFIVTQERKGRRVSIANAERAGFGTAVLLFAGEKDYLFVTSRHVLDGEDWDQEKPYDGDALLLDREGGASPAKILARHKSLDLMLLRVPRSTEGRLFAQDVLDFSEVEAGERIMIFGHPQGLFFSLADGLVSRKEKGGLIQITAPVSPGASGGPVFDLRGRLLGIVSGMMDKRQTPYAENLNFAVSAESLLHPDQWDAVSDDLAALQSFVAARTSPEPAPSLPTASQP